MKIVKARLVKLKTDDGLVEVKDGVEIGKEYSIDLHAIKVVGWMNLVHGRIVNRETATDFFDGGSIPTELLEVEEG